MSRTRVSRTRVHCFALSLDGFATGEGLSLEQPFGHAGHRLHEWMLATRYGHVLMGKEGGGRGVDDVFAKRFLSGIGAEIMGAGKFGPPGWQSDPDWKGGAEPAVPHADLRPHPPTPAIHRDGGRHDVPLPRHLARRGAEDRPRRGRGLDVRIGGDTTVVRDFLAAGLIDYMHVVILPIVLGRGVRLWDGLEVQRSGTPAGFFPGVELHRSSMPRRRLSKFAAETK